MKLSEFSKPAPPVSESVPTHEPPASEAPQEEQYYTSITPSGIEVAYSPAPRRHYKLRRNEQIKGALRIDGTDWTEVPSVTSVLGVLDKSGPLIWWSQGVACEGIIELFGRSKLLGKPVEGLDQHALTHTGGSAATKESLVDLLVEQKLSSNHQRDKAADRGVNVHGALEAWCEEGIIPEPSDHPEHEYGYVAGLQQFLMALGLAVEDQKQELMVGSLQYSYAGRFDLVLTLSKPVEVTTKIYPKRKPRVEEIPAGRYLLDLKTSKGIYNTHYLQLEAYEAAAVECGYAPTDHRGVIHVTADGRYELALNKDWCFDDFLAVRRCYQVLNEREVLRVLREDLDAKEVA